MKPRKKQQAAPGALDTVEEAFCLVRKAPASVLATYYIGSLPFILGLLYFWADMSKSAYAREHLAGGALGVSLLFIWMKTWQAVYARRLLAEMCGETPAQWTLARVTRVVMRQTIVQPWGLLVLPVALIVALPFGWTYAFFQNVTALDGSETGEIRSLVRKAAGMAGLWPAQNHLLIWALSPFLMVAAVTLYVVIIPILATFSPDWTSIILGIYSAIYLLALMPLSPFGVIIAANIATAILLVPQLLRTFLGVETAFVHSPMSMLNSTFFAVVCGLTYLCMDPLMKAAYVVRCFYGESIHTGADLRMELKRFADKAKFASVLFGIVAAILFSNAASAQGTAPGPGVSAAELGKALDRELLSPQYAWRMPRPPRPETEDNFLLAFLRAVGETLRDWWRALMRWLREALEWLRDHMPDFGGENETSAFGMGRGVRTLLYVLLAVLLAIAAVMIWRIWRQRGTQSRDVLAELVRVSPNLEDENTVADQLPEDGWLVLAREAVERGELRLALRAVFLASLAALADRELIRIARFKSNRDYRDELGRRAHAEPAVLDTFSQSVMIYETVWYGAHETTREMLDRVIANQERLRACAQE
jgi:hypothetical protein